MTLEEYAEKYPRTMSITEKRIDELKSQLWESDFKNDPNWVIHQNEEHNKCIWREIRRLQMGKEQG